MLNPARWSPPENRACSILREVDRFSSGEADDYPPVPENYFSGHELELLERHRSTVIDARRQRTDPPPLPGSAVGRRRKVAGIGPGALPDWLGATLESKVEAPTRGPLEYP